MMAVQLVPMPRNMVDPWLLRAAWDRESACVNTCVMCVQAGLLGRASSQARAGRSMRLVMCCVELQQ